jgi:outer membrane protein assembly factor BamB
VLHVLGLASGKDLQKPALFLPPNSKWSDPIAVNETMYAATSQNCGGSPNGIWAIDLAGENKPVTAFTTNGGGIVGGLTFTTDGTLIAAIGAGPVTPGGYTNAIVAFDPKTLKVKDWYTSPTAEFVSSPLVFKHNDKDIIAAATKDGRVLLLDASSLGGANHATPLFASRSFTSSPATFAPEALAYWEEMVPAPNAPAPAAGAGAGAAGAAPPAAAGAPPPAPAMQPGTRWLLLPVAGPLPSGVAATSGAITNGALVALKVVNDGGKLSLQPGWVSRDLTTPMTPLIVNGVVFAVSKGKAAAAAATSATPAVVYALNGVDGKELWNSGTTITSYVPGRSLWSATGQVYVGTFDGSVYAFGFAMERK